MAFKVDLIIGIKISTIANNCITAITLLSVNNNVNDNLNKLRPLIKELQTAFLRPCKAILQVNPERN